MVTLADAAQYNDYDDYPNNPFAAAAEEAVIATAIRTAVSAAIASTETETHILHLLCTSYAAESGLVYILRMSDSRKPERFAENSTKQGKNHERKETIQ